MPAYSAARTYVVRKLYSVITMAAKVPQPKGLSRAGNCPVCFEEETDQSSEYKHPELEVKVQDKYCKNCGSVLGFVKVSDS